MTTDSTSKNEELSEVIPKALGKYLLENVEGLKEYYDEFPAAHRNFVTPSVSIIVSSDSFRPLAVKQPIKPTVAPDPATPDGFTQKKQQVNWVVGIEDFRVQIDIWARNKEERDDLVGSVFNAMNPEISPSGLRLKLDEYFDQICDYLLVSRKNGDSEAAAQTDEWRSTWEALATCKTVQTAKEFVIEKPSVIVEPLNTDEPIS